jgi:hypothetical protein
METDTSKVEGEVNFPQDGQSLCGGDNWADT